MHKITTACFSVVIKKQINYGWQTKPPPYWLFCLNGPAKPGTRGYWELPVNLFGCYSPWENPIYPHKVSSFKMYKYPHIWATPDRGIYVYKVWYQGYIFAHIRDVVFNVQGVCYCKSKIYKMKQITIKIIMYSNSCMFDTPIK